ncbi:iron-sulfur cluster assembly protein [Gordonia amicalis]|uniref:Iron-sulfur cluster assembly protein n=1 Tax=Gordonia amicalis TaxID=89053 RepID=A0AAE4R183_9ACTN|nr:MULTISPECIES: iron-sulfur cluster assembly protein [Gordonia]MBA5846117.1 iron-sulfur cluster assembly protein [Gordonia amicalis]MCZ0914329.1 iron-sulfur cluster assembly protein [Gordonia amicalis]MDV6311159.1 iron-sulfur cluster assembly protein [Gordonia amicalis]MDV7175172.1 iron-sulfur cluster assembly protein [Gordonia amicalis]UOG22856.1 iron-sulfur cluster assembly protein [Gordonia amicalis]
MTAVAPLPGYVAGTAVELERDVLAALDTVLDPELDQPITELRFVRSILIDEAGVTVHLRLPTSFCSPNFAYLMGSDALDARAGYKGTFGVEALESLDELRLTFQRKAHTAAMERAVAAEIAAGRVTVAEVDRLALRDLPRGQHKSALLRRRMELGLSICPNSLVVVDEEGHALPVDQVPMRLRFARSVRISMEGNSHFCRGLLATRYADDDECDGASGPVITNLRETPRAHHRSEQE